MHALERTIIRLEQRLREVKLSPAEEGEMSRVEFIAYKCLLEDLEEEIMLIKNYLS